MPGKRPDRLLTEVELELMTALWELGGGTVNELLSRLARRPPLAYTSVSTILRILEQKGVLRSEKVGRGHRYVPLITRSAYQEFALGQVVGKVFGGEPLALVRQLVNTKGLSPDDLAALKTFVDERARKPR